MYSFTQNKVIVTGKTYDDVYSFLDEAIVDNRFLFNNLVPLGFSKNIIAEAKRNWGCRHDVDNKSAKIARAFKRNINKKHFKYNSYANFNTFDSSPRMYLDKVSQKFPNLTFECIYEGEENRLGSYKYRNGEIISSNNLENENILDRVLFRIKNKFNKSAAIKELRCEYVDKHTSCLIDVIKLKILKLLLNYKKERL